MPESHLRSLIKAISYRFLGTVVTFTISYLITDSMIVASSISVLELISKLGLYWIHERIWNRIKFGKHGT